MRDHADAFEQPALLQHRPRPSHDPADDRVVPLGQARKFLQKLAANIGPEVVVARADNIGRFQTRVRSACRGTRCVRSRAAADCETDPSGSYRSPAMGARRSETGSTPPASTRSLGRRSENLRRALAEGGKQIPKLHRVELDRRRRAEQDVPGVARHSVQEAEQVVRRRGRIPACGSRGTRALCAPRRAPPRRKISLPARRARRHRRH